MAQSAAARATVAETIDSRFAEFGATGGPIGPAKGAGKAKAKAKGGRKGSSTGSSRSVSAEEQEKRDFDSQLASLLSSTLVIQRGCSHWRVGLSISLATRLVLLPKSPKESEPCAQRIGLLFYRCRRSPHQDVWIAEWCAKARPSIRLFVLSTQFVWIETAVELLQHFSLET